MQQPGSAQAPQVPLLLTQGPGLFWSQFCENAVFGWETGISFSSLRFCRFLIPHVLPVSHPSCPASFSPLMSCQFLSPQVLPVSLPSGSAGFSPQVLPVSLPSGSASFSQLLPVSLSFCQFLSASAGFPQLLPVSLSFCRFLSASASFS